MDRRRGVDRPKGLGQWLGTVSEIPQLAPGTALTRRRKLNPAAILLSKQLPLFLAELQALDQPRGSAANIFPLYEITGKLLQQWEALCPG